MRFLFLVLASLTLLTPTLATPIYNPDAHGIHQHRAMKTQHLRHIDEHGHVTYIHDVSDHRPDFCSIPGEEELCRLQIEQANAEPPVMYNGPTSIFEEPSELNPEALHGGKKQHIMAEPKQGVEVAHPGDEILHIDGEEILIHTDHPGNMRPVDGNAKRHVVHKMDASEPQEPTKRPRPDAVQDAVLINEDGFVPQEHIRNIRDESTVPDEPHARNIRETGDELPAEIVHTRNINVHPEVIKKNVEDTPSEEDIPIVGSFPPRPQTIQQNTRPIMKLQKEINA